MKVSMSLFPILATRNHAHLAHYPLRPDYRRELDRVKNTPSEGVKESPARGRGRRNRLPHHGKHWPSQGGAGGFACVSTFFHGFSRSRLGQTRMPSHALKQAVR